MNSFTERNSKLAKFRNLHYRAYSNPSAEATQQENSCESIDLEMANVAAAAAVAEARKHSWTIAIAVLDTGGELVFFEKMDGTQTASVQLAIDKARSAVLYRRPTKTFEDALAKGGENLRILAFRAAIPVDGGFPLVMNGRVVGSISRRRMEPMPLRHRQRIQTASPD